VLGANIILPKKALKRDNRYQRDKKRKLCKINKTAFYPVPQKTLGILQKINPVFAKTKKSWLSPATFSNSKHPSNKRYATEAMLVQR
jgi:hypothetical protein